MASASKRIKSGRFVLVLLLAVEQFVGGRRKLQIQFWTFRLKMLSWSGLICVVVGSDFDEAECSSADADERVSKLISAGGRRGEEAVDESPPPPPISVVASPILVVVSIRSSRDETARTDTIIFDFVFSGSSSSFIRFRIDSSR
jgi:hypothetical protein